MRFTIKITALCKVFLMSQLFTSMLTPACSVPSSHKAVLRCASKPDTRSLILYPPIRISFCCCVNPQSYQMGWRNIFSPAFTEEIFSARTQVSFFHFASSFTTALTHQWHLLCGGLSLHTENRLIHWKWTLERQKVGKLTVATSTRLKIKKDSQTRISLSDIFI